VVLYFANPTSNPLTHEAMREGKLGFIDTPRQGNGKFKTNEMQWCADNGCFNDSSFNEEKWWKWLQNPSHNISSCVFATAPDVMGNAEATIKRSKPWLSAIRSLGYPAAFVAQDGSDEYPPPWADFDVLFIGGTTEFKLGPVARELARQAKELGLWVHCGRVNSYKRLNYATLPYPYGLSADSADGTHLTFAPDINLPKVLRWLEKIDNQPSLLADQGGLST
jgi:hypothetical protein